MGNFKEMGDIEKILRDIESEREKGIIDQWIKQRMESDFDNATWSVTPSPRACKECQEFASKTYTERPERPHPNCQCEIVRDDWNMIFPPQKNGERYYKIGRRPLDGADLIFNKNRKESIMHSDGYSIRYNLALEHQQFIDGDGNNFGFFGDSNIKSDDENLYQYKFGDIKYDAKLIDEARKNIEKRREAQKKAYEDIKRWGSQAKSYDVWSYLLPLNNCQSTIEDILNVAEEIAEKQKRRLILD